MHILLICLTVASFVIEAFGQQEGDLRLVGGTNIYEGLVNIYHNNQWGTVCQDGFDNREASVVCHQLGYEPSVNAVAVRNTFGSGTGPIWLDDVDCSGNEQELVTCRASTWNNTDCTHAEDIGVRCPQPSSEPSRTTSPTPTTTQSTVIQPSNCTVPDPNIRLKGFNSEPGVGVVQILNQSQWGSICDDDWDRNDARVICRMLCYDPVNALAGGSAFNASAITEPIMLTNVNCNGNELDLDSCQKSDWSQKTCHRNEQAAVTCTQLSNAAPIYPVPEVNCSSGYITSTFSKAVDQFLEPKHLAVAAPGSTCNVVKTGDLQFVTIAIPLDECGTSATANSTHIIYNNTIIYSPTHNKGDVTVANTFYIKVQCEFPKNTTNQRPIMPLTETITQRAPGAFLVNLNFFANNSFYTTNLITNFPLEITLGEWLSAGLFLDEVDSHLRLVVPDCFATPSSDRNDEVNYPMFIDKCSADPTLSFYPLNNTAFGFRYQTFKFVQYPLVYIHCDAIVCLTSETSSECDRSCIPTTTAAPTTSATNRRRRSASDHQIIYVSSGGMRVYSRSDDNVVERERPNGTSPPPPSYNHTVGGPAETTKQTTRGPTTQVVIETVTSPTPGNTPPPIRDTTSAKPAIQTTSSRSDQSETRVVDQSKTSSSNDNVPETTTKHAVGAESEDIRDKFVGNYSSASSTAVALPVVNVFFLLVYMYLR